jgi:hypothetical protein
MIRVKIAQTRGRVAQTNNQQHLLPRKQIAGDKMTYNQIHGFFADSVGFSQPTMTFSGPPHDNRASTKADGDSRLSAPERPAGLRAQPGQPVRAASERQVGVSGLPAKGWSNFSI